MQNLNSNPSQGWRWEWLKKERKVGYKSNKDINIAKHIIVYKPSAHINPFLGKGGKKDIWLPLVLYLKVN